MNFDNQLDVLGAFIIIGTLAVVLVLALTPAMLMLVFSAPSWAMVWAWVWAGIVMFTALTIAIALLRL